MDKIEPKLATSESARKQLNCGVWTVKNLIHTGKLDGIKLGHRTTMVTQASIDRLIAGKSEIAEPFQA